MNARGGDNVSKEQQAMDLLRRALNSSWALCDKDHDESCDCVGDEARAILAAPEVEAVWAETSVHFYSVFDDPGGKKWLFITNPPNSDKHATVRVPVPAHLLAPIVLEGEVVSPEVKP